MPQCKTCGKKCSFWSGGLCKECVAKAEACARAAEAELAKKAALEEEERTRKALDEVEQKIAVILSALTDEQPRGYAFINWGIMNHFVNGETAMENAVCKASGFLIGTALGGVGGEMLVGGALMRQRQPGYSVEIAKT